MRRAACITPLSLSEPMVMAIHGGPIMENAIDAAILLSAGSIIVSIVVASSELG